MLRNRLRLVILAVVAVACGIDAVGTRVDGAAVTPAPPADEDGASNVPRVDASSAETSADADAPTSDAGDGSVPLGPLCPTDAQGLVACFAFEGNTTDDSPVRVTLLSSANVAYGAGREGLAAVFSPSPKTDVRLPFAGMNTPAMTIEVWLKPASLPAAGERFSIVDMEGRFGVSLTPDGTLRCRALATTKKVTIGSWTHLACVNDGATMSAFVDGTIDTSVANVLGTTSDFIGIGQDSTSTNDTYDGTMDNLRIWTRGLTPAEVAAAAAR